MKHWSQKPISLVENSVQSMEKVEKYRNYDDRDDYVFLFCYKDGLYQIWWLSGSKWDYLTLCENNHQKPSLAHTYDCHGQLLFMSKVRFESKQLNWWTCFVTSRNGPFLLTLLLVKVCAHTALFTSFLWLTLNIDETFPNNRYNGLCLLANVHGFAEARALFVCWGETDRSASCRLLSDELKTKTVEVTNVVLNLRESVHTNYHKSHFVDEKVQHSLFCVTLYVPEKRTFQHQERNLRCCRPQKRVFHEKLALYVSRCGLEHSDNLISCAKEDGEIKTESASQCTYFEEKTSI